MSGVNEIRQSFLDFFKAKGHEVLPSSSLLPMGDPTLMFTNAGMVQFKNVFTGLEKLPYKTAATSQKCVRAGGKHNDLDNVGYTERHHTFFEMLGNFSFGDYFKEKAIYYAWELLTKDYGLDPERLTATVFHEDEEAFKLWKKISGLPESRIIKIASHDNFWAMGEVGPCGPCSEIFYDHGNHLPGSPPGTKDEDLGRFVEIWNLVFMEFNQVTPEQRNDLPQPSIDTGMGLERLAAVLQGTHDNYQIDTFKALIEASVAETGIPAKGKQKASHRVIADHIRAVSFLIADGVLPSNEGRGYVLRRIMRRAMRHGHILGNKDLLLHKLVPTLIREMGQAYPELGRAEALITETLKLEETRFHAMLVKGLKLLFKAREGLAKGKPLPGDVAFKLYDTYGFPLDLTQDAMKSEGLSVDTKGFDTAMEKQKKQARAAWKGSGEHATDEVWFDIREEVGATEFLGYDSEAAEALIVAMVRDGKRVKRAKKGEKVAIICNQTPFYGESGGQIGDTGTLRGAKSTLLVTDTQKKLDNLVVHLGEVKDVSISLGDAVHLKVDHERRLKIRANHSVT
ncbi:MAG: alanine--tRNA ligase, partial [Alphaproteobacteria bacterium]